MALEYTYVGLLKLNFDTEEGSRRFSESSIGSTATVETFVSADSGDEAAVGYFFADSGDQAAAGHAFADSGEKKYRYDEAAREIARERGVGNLEGQFIFVVPAEYRNDFRDALRYLKSTKLPQKPEEGQKAFFMRYVGFHHKEKIDFHWIKENLAPLDLVDGGEYAIVVAPIFETFAEDMQKLWRDLLVNRGAALTAYMEKFVTLFNPEEKPRNTPTFRR